MHLLKTPYTFWNSEGGCKSGVGEWHLLNDSSVAEEHLIGEKASHLISYITHVLLNWNFIDRFIIVNHPEYIIYTSKIDIPVEPRREL